MFRVRDGVKFGASCVCPMCNSGPVGAVGIYDLANRPESEHRTACCGRVYSSSTRERNDVGISGTPGRAGALRTNVRTGTGTAGGVAGPAYECPGSCGATRSVLHQPAESRASGDGLEDDQPGVGSREGIGAVGDGRDAPGKTKTTELTIE